MLSGRDGGIDAAGRPTGADGAPELSVELLGRFRVRIGARTLPQTAWGRRAGELIKLLALEPGHCLPREQVMDRLWPELGPAAAANNLHQTLHAARRVFEPDLRAGVPSTYLRLDGDSVALRAPGRVWIDVEAFELAAATARHAQEPAAYQAALELYAGDLLPEDRYQDWATHRREELRSLYLSLLMELARLYEQRDEHVAAIRTLERVVASEPAHEEAHTELMALHARMGRRQQALRQYQQLCEALRRELETEPDSDTQRLYADIRAGRLSSPGELARIGPQGPDWPGRRASRRTTCPAS